MKRSICAFAATVIAILCVPVTDTRAETEQAASLPMREESVQVGDMSQHFRRVGQGPPLLLLHGLTNTWRVWRPHLDALGATHALIVPDLRGHGDTPNPSSTLSSPQVAADMFVLLDALKIERIQVAGYSFGGHVALRMAAMHPERVEAMVVLAGAHRLIGSTIQYHQDAVRSDIPPDWWLTEVSRWHPGGEKQVQSLNRQGCAAALTDEFTMSDASLAAIRARTLIIQGDRDEVFPIDVPLELYRKIKGSQLWIIPNANHSSVFWQDVAPAGTDYGGNPAATKSFPDIVQTFLTQGR
jgi:pimeloyl-ACP methyl ester carboxylesterase